MTHAESIFSSHQAIYCRGLCSLLLIISSSIIPSSGLAQSNQSIMKEATPKQKKAMSAYMERQKQERQDWERKQETESKKSQTQRIVENTVRGYAAFALDPAGMVIDGMADAHPDDKAVQNRAKRLKQGIAAAEVIGAGSVVGATKAAGSSTIQGWLRDKVDPDAEQRRYAESQRQGAPDFKTWKKNQDAGKGESHLKQLLHK